MGYLGIGFSVGRRFLVVREKSAGFDRIGEHWKASDLGLNRHLDGAVLFAKSIGKAP